MSGTSLDGLDIYVEFEQNEKWQFKLGICETIPYNEEWKVQLSSLHKQSKIKIQQNDIKYGLYIGKLVKNLYKKIVTGRFYLLTRAHNFPSTRE